MNNHRHHHRPNPISLPPRVVSSSNSRLYPSFPVPQTPTPTPSKSKLRSLNNYGNNPRSFSSVIFLLFSLQPLYSLLPFLQSVPFSFSLFPFCFLVSLLSFALSLLFFSFPRSKLNTHAIFPLFPNPSILPSLLPTLVAKSSLLALSFLLRFQSLRSCGTGPTILAEFSGSLAAQFAFSRTQSSDRIRYFRGFFTLVFALFLLANSWDRAVCFPFNGGKVRSFLFFSADCVRIAPMLLPFVSGFLCYYERSSTNWGQLRTLGRRRVRVISLFFATLILLVPAAVSFFAAEGDPIFVKNLGWPLLNTVIFGVILSENYTEEKLFNTKDLRKDFIVTFVCTIILELFYFPELSLLGFLLCGCLLWISVVELGSSSVSYPELGFDSSETLSAVILKPIRHILSERKSRKIALFLLINTAYMVVEFVAGFLSNSLGLISDACHMLFDCAALAIGLYASYISRLPANYQFNYGRGRFEVLSGYVNAVLLVLVGVLIVLESFERILDPQEISTSSLLVVSIGGLLVNVIGLIFFHEEHHHAHGGVGTCSHSHIGHHHHHTYLDDQKKDHEFQDEHKKCVSISCDSSHGKACGKESHSPETAHCDDHGEKNLNREVKQSNPSNCCSPDGHHCGRGQDQQNGSSHGKTEGDIHHKTEKAHGHGHQCHGKTEGEIHHKTEKAHGHGHQCHGHHVTVQQVSPAQIDESSLEGKTGEKPRKHKHVDHNMEGIFLHVLADTMGSVGVVISTLLIKYKGWLVADPACSIFISIMIISSVVPLLRNSAEILLQRVPRAHEKELRKAFDSVMKVKGVSGAQNIHMWNLTNTDVVGTLHLKILAEIDRDSVKDRVSHILHDAGIKDLTLEVESVKGN